MVPLLKITVDHGPTEFCMGSSWLEGMPGYPMLGTPLLGAEIGMVMETTMTRGMRYLSSVAVYIPEDIRVGIRGVSWL